MLKLSIIIASRNVARSIAYALSSINEQRDFNMRECIIIDGASNDGTVGVIKEHVNMLAYWVSEPDKGIYDAMNKGILHASGDYIYFLGADDLLYDERVMQRVVQELEQYHPDVLCGRVMQLDEELGIQRLVGGPLTREDVLCAGKMPPHQGMFVRRDLLQQVGFDCRYKASADFDMFVRLLFTGAKIRFSDEVVAFYRTGGCSADRFLVYSEYKQILRKYGCKHLSTFECRRRKGLVFSYVERILPKTCLRSLLCGLGWKMIE